MNQTNIGIENIAIQDFRAMMAGTGTSVIDGQTASSNPFFAMISQLMSTANKDQELLDKAEQLLAEDANLDMGLINQLSALLGITNPFAHSEKNFDISAKQNEVLTGIINTKDMQTTVTQQNSSAFNDQEMFINNEAIKQKLGFINIKSEKTVNTEGLKTLVQTEGNFIRFTAQTRKDLENNLEQSSSNASDLLASTMKTEAGEHLFEKKLGNLANAPALQDQIANGIKENLSLSKTEFTIKLHPESLGEITVKLIDEDGTKTLQIMTAAAKTAGLINDEINGLREALRPMNIEVKDTVVATSSSSESQLQQFDMSGQNFFNRQNQNGNSSHSQMQGQESELEAEPEQTVDLGNLSVYV